MGARSPTRPAPAITGRLSPAKAQAAFSRALLQAIHAAAQDIDFLVGFPRLVGLGLESPQFLDLLLEVPHVYRLGGFPFLGDALLRLDGAQELFLVHAVHPGQATHFQGVFPEFRRGHPVQGFFFFVLLFLFSHDPLSSLVSGWLQPAVIICPGNRFCCPCTNFCHRRQCEDRAN